MVKKYAAVAVIALFLFVCFALPLINFEDSPTSFNSLSSISTTSVKIGKYHFTPEETETINSKIEGGYFVNG